VQAVELLKWRPVRYASSSSARADPSARQPLLWQKRRMTSAAETPPILPAHSLLRTSPHFITCNCNRAGSSSTHPRCLLIRANLSAAGDPVRLAGGSANDPALEWTPNGTASESCERRRPRLRDTTTTRAAETTITMSRLRAVQGTGGRRRTSSPPSPEKGAMSTSTGRARQRRALGPTRTPSRGALRIERR
jgi:hypothetical protein